jgi:hypothetical protein
MTFGRMFGEGVKRAIELIKKGPIKPKDVAEAADKVRKAAEKLPKKR